MATQLLDLTLAPPEPWGGLSLGYRYNQNSEALLLDPEGYWLKLPGWAWRARFTLVQQPSPLSRIVATVSRTLGTAPGTSARRVITTGLVYAPAFAFTELSGVVELDVCGVDTLRIVLDQAETPDNIYPPPAAAPVPQPIDFLLSIELRPRVSR